MVFFRQRQISALTAVSTGEQVFRSFSCPLRQSIQYQWPFSRSIMFSETFRNIPKVSETLIYRLLDYIILHVASVR